MYTCDVCGVALDAQEVYAFVVSYAMPGKNQKSFSCPDEQHFGCSPEHAIQAAKACVDHLDALRKAQEGK